MKIIGIVGGSGAGKSVLCNALEKRGIPTLDTDKTAREVVEKGKPCLEKLASEFGKEILDENGELIRKKLAEIAFSDRKRHEALNTITHKYIVEEVKRWLYEMDMRGCNAVSIDAPMLFESGLDKICDVKIAVVAPEEMRIKRIILRDGIDENAAKKRIKSQKSEAELRELCDIVIENDGTPEEFTKKAEALSEKLISEE